MPIGSSDIVYRRSVTTGAAGDSTAGTAAGSLGRYVSTTDVPVSAGGMFDDISGAENAASTVDFRCIFVLNNHPTLTLINPVVYLSAEVADGAVVAIAVDNIAASAKGSSSVQAATIANELTAPSGTGSFSSPTTPATGLSLGASLAPGQARAVWVRRSAANTGPVNNDGVTLAVYGDTAA